MARVVPVGDETVTYQGTNIQVVTQKVQIQDKVVTFERARRSPGIRLLIVTSEPKIMLTREYRSELSTWDYRLPGGKVFDSVDEYCQALASGDDIEDFARKAAKKEAHEEAGIDADDVKLVSVSHCGALVEWDLWYFLLHAEDSAVGVQQLEPGEEIVVHWFTFDEAREIALRGQMREDRSVAILLRYLHSQV